MQSYYDYLQMWRKNVAFQHQTDVLSFCVYKRLMTAGDGGCCQQKALLTSMHTSYCCSKQFFYVFFSDANLLNRAAADVQNNFIFSDLSSFKPAWIFIVTWKNISFCGADKVSQLLNRLVCHRWNSVG
jgi:hypothetical protein